MKLNEHKIYTCAETAGKQNLFLDEFKQAFAKNVASYVNDAILNKWDEVVRFYETENGYSASISFLCK